MDKVPQETEEPPFKLFRDDITLEEIAFKRTKLADKKEKVGEAFQDAFELVGGVPRLALYADENYGDFLRHYAKMIPRENEMKHSGEIFIRPALPPSPLDDPIDVTPEGIQHQPGQLECLSGGGDNPSLVGDSPADRAPSPVSNVTRFRAPKSKEDGE